MTSRAPAQAPYTNPVIGNPERVDREIADPFVLKFNGEYYLYSSGAPIIGFHSTDLVHWDLIGPVLFASDKPEAWNQADVWAPEVDYRNGNFYMYYTASRQSDDWRVGEMARRIGVAVSKSPRGPFIDSGRPVTPGWGIDATLFQDPDGGQDYLFYSYLYEPRLPGAGIVADEMTGWNTVAGKPTNVTRGSEAWEDKDGDPNNGSLRYTNEGPTVLKHHGLYYLMYSGGSWDLPTYALAYATSNKVMNGGLDGPGWHKYVPPILRGTSLVEAPGHNGMTKAPNDVDDVCIYHARVLPFIDPSNRLPFVDRLYWNHDRMFMDQPSLGDVSLPDQPLFSDNFNRPNGALGPRWNVVRGQWGIVDGQARASQPAKDNLAVAVPRLEKLSHYIFEANLRSGQGKPGSRIGIAAFYLDEQNHVDVWLDSASRSLVINGELVGQPLSESRTDLHSEFDAGAYHQVIAVRNANQISVDVDGVHAQSRSFNLGPRAGTVALETLGAGADFDGIAITPYFDDTFDAGVQNNAMWSTVTGAWLTEEGAFHQVSGGTARAVALKGDPSEDYEFTASLRWRDNESVGSKAGIVAASSGDEMVLGGFDRTIWPLARFWVQHLVKGAVTEEFGMGLPRGFEYDEYHTIRVVKQGNAFTFFLDGKETAAARFSMGVSRPGLFTEGVRAAFDDCLMKRVVARHNLLLNGSFETEQWDGSAATPDNPWKLSGGARPNDCCAHSGSRRLLITGGNGEAKQSVTGLSPGSYTLDGWVITSAAGEAQVKVEPTGGSPQHTSVQGQRWTRFSLTFAVPSGGNSASISISARPKPGSNDLVAADDFYLFKRSP